MMLILPGFTKNIALGQRAYFLACCTSGKPNSNKPCKLTSNHDTFNHHAGKAPAHQKVDMTLMNCQPKPKILRLNASGEPVGWISWQYAAYLYARTLVLWTPGRVILTLRGGYNRTTNAQSLLPIHSIIACKGRIVVSFPDRPTSLTNTALFNRDEHRCLYCGHRFSATQLTRDHIKPQSKGGKDTWINCATACRRCNYRKGGRMPEEARMQLLALPYQPNYAEYLTLCNSGRILGDQWQFLQTRFSAKHRASFPEHCSAWASRQP